MSVRITDNTVRIKIDNTRGASLAIRYMLDAIDATASPRTPKEFGVLRRSVQKRVTGLKGEIQWPQKYAQAQEAGVIRGTRVKNYSTPGTGAHFAESAVRKVVQNADSYFRKARAI